MIVLWTMLFVGVLLLICWKAYANRHFRGPSRADEAALKELEVK